MPWFKIDDTLHSHPKIRGAGLPAMGLWALAGSYSMAYKTDGFVPMWFVETWPQGARRARELTQNGLWNETETGFQFHDWDDFQPTADEIEKDRESARERQRRRREKQREARLGHAPVTRDTPRDVTRDSGGDVQGESQHPDPSRPVPSRPEPPTEVVGARKKPKREHRLPDDFKPTDKHQAKADELRLDLPSEFEQFCDHHVAKGSKYEDWGRALHTWLRNSAKYRDNRPGNIRQMPQGPRIDEHGNPLLPPLPSPTEWMSR